MFKDICTPAHLYLVLSIVAIIIGIFNQFSALAILVKVFFVLLWTTLLNYLCSKGLSVVSWIFVILPFVAILSSLILLMEGHKVQHIVYSNSK
jgi:hypothetical protein